MLACPYKSNHAFRLLMVAVRLLGCCLGVLAEVYGLWSLVQHQCVGFVLALGSINCKFDCLEKKTSNI